MGSHMETGAGLNPDPRGPQVGIGCPPNLQIEYLCVLWLQAWKKGF